MGGGRKSREIYLLSGPVQTGKTTRLRAWCDKVQTGFATGHLPVDGILAPVINGHRHLLNISSGAMRDLEDVTGGTAAVVVRRFTFNAEVFAWARDCLMNAAKETVPRWIVVDEVGPLEIAGGGLEPAVSTLLESERSAGGGPHRLLIVVRDHLVDGALKHYGLSPADVHHFPFA